MTASLNRWLGAKARVAVTAFERRVEGLPYAAADLLLRLGCPRLSAAAADVYVDSPMTTAYVVVCGAVQAIDTLLLPGITLKYFSVYTLEVNRCKRRGWHANAIQTPGTRR